MKLKLKPLLFQSTVWLASSHTWVHLLWSVITCVISSKTASGRYSTMRKWRCPKIHQRTSPICICTRDCEESDVKRQCMVNIQLGHLIGVCGFNSGLKYICNTKAVSEVKNLKSELSLCISFKM